MKKVLGFLFAAAIATAAGAQAINIIPQPAEMRQPKIAANFVITPSTPIVLQGSNLQNAANFLNDYLDRFYHFKLKLSGSSSAKKIGVYTYLLRLLTNKKNFFHF